MRTLKAGFLVKPCANWYNILRCVTNGGGFQRLSPRAGLAESDSSPKLREVHFFRAHRKKRFSRRSGKRQPEFRRYGTIKIPASLLQKRNSRVGCFEKCRISLNYEVEGGLQSRGISTEQFILEMNVRRFM